MLDCSIKAVVYGSQDLQLAAGKTRICLPPSAFFSIQFLRAPDRVLQMITHHPRNDSLLRCFYVMKEITHPEIPAVSPFNLFDGVRLMEL
jgi:hypothetical protein